MSLNAYDYTDIVKPLGVDYGDLGCLMLDVVTPHIHLDADYQYFSPDPKRFWIKGKVWDDAHMTVKYGFVKSAQTYKPQIKKMLDGFDFGDIELDRWEVFDSTMRDEPYKCIVGLIKKTEPILEANALMSFLPHVDTFNDYKPHVTFSYVHELDVEDVLSMLPNPRTLTLRAKRLNFGRA